MASDIRKAETGSPYLTDESKMVGSADNIIIPETEEDVIKITEEHFACGRPITISGMRTGMCGGCVPFGGDVLSTEKLNKVIGIGRDERGYYVRVQPAVTVRELNEVLRKKLYTDLTDITENAVGSLLGEGTDFFYPVDPTELNSSLGGNIAVNSSGPRTLKYGPTRNWVRRIRAVLADGCVMDIKRTDITAEGRMLRFRTSKGEREVPLPSYDYNMNVKNSTGIMAKDGMDMVDLFIGSEGIFGTVTEADLYIVPWHPLISNIFFFPNDSSAYLFVEKIQKSDINPEFLEYFDSGSLNLLRTAAEKDPNLNSMPGIPDGAGSAVFMDLPMDDTLMSNYRKIEILSKSNGGSLENSWCGHELRDREKFFGFRHSVPQIIFEYVAGLKGKVPKIHKMGTDMSVPLKNLGRMMTVYSKTLDRYGLEHVTFGHIGNGHLHVEIILKDMDNLTKAKEAYRELAIKAIRLGGSPSAEHGIGKIKREYVELMYGKKGTEEMKKTKEAMDPRWILCPGNMVEK
ncbi:MAG: FAD-binding oxidoreductase [Candidatus Methanoplasma sp.]|jgi:D-lactate dehydrogenase (cytochrome)|nr:FAD-binding oxidoreductase [Candidatus Methanoplasma sp.]